jgi:hypothetical protein
MFSADGDANLSEPHPLGQRFSFEERLICSAGFFRADFAAKLVRALF